MSELSDEASESEQLGASLSLWLGGTGGQLVRLEELDVPLDLHTACSIGQYDVVAECIRRRDVDLDCKNIGGWTPLMYAAYIGHDNIANLLLEAGVNVNATTPKGQTPLMLAASCGNESIAYFLLQQGAEMEMKDARGWTALFHCTSTGHQQMVKFLLDNNANANIKEPISEFSLLMEAAASGHEIIAQYLLEHGVKVEERNAKGETARALAILYGHTKIASLIDMHCARSKAGHFEDLSSSEDSDSAPRRPRLARSKIKGPSIHDGPQAIAKFGVGGTGRHYEPTVAPPGYVTFRDMGEQNDRICNRDVTSPINELDGQSNSSRGMESSRSRCSRLPPFLFDTFSCLGITLFGPKRKMTSAIARWHSRARPPSDALEQAYADRLEAEMQEMAIQLHKRCEEVEILQGQVSQEKELRTVMEGCLMEDKTAWRRVHAELVDLHRLAQEMGADLEKTRTLHLYGLQGKNLQVLTQSLRRLSTAEKVTENWEAS
uniref:Ankyrin repeat and sterile alpha motif domain containing 3 n=1 Tax=Scleropages formosus TaxID=113540 RepID=A0A8C9VJB4_SCLFO